MEHMAWKGRIKPGCKAEYQRRHAEIWPEMVKVLKDAGICNYSIFYCNDELFGYYECEKGVAYAEKVQAESPVVDRWNDYMKDILELEMDPVTGAQPKLEQVFRLDRERAKHRYAGKSPRCLWQRGLLPCQTIYNAPSERTLS